MSRHRRRDKVTVDSRARARIYHGEHGFWIGALSSNVARRHDRREIQIALIDIGRRISRRNHRCPIAIRVRHNDLWRIVGIGDEDADVGDVRLADLLHSVAVCIHVEMAGDSGRDVVSIDAAGNRGICDGDYDCRVGAFFLHIGRRNYRREIGVGFIDIRRSISRWDNGGPIAGRVCRHGLRYIV